MYNFEEWILSKPIGLTDKQAEQIFHYYQACDDEKVDIIRGECKTDEENSLAIQENPVLKQAEVMFFDYKVKINSLVKNMGWYDLQRLYKICGSIHTRNCGADKYFASKELLETIQSRIMWMRFNRSVHGISVIDPAYTNPISRGSMDDGMPATGGCEKQSE